jgi:hypothetical protein
LLFRDVVEKRMVILEAIELFSRFHHDSETRVSLSPPLAGGKRALLLIVILLILDSCDLPVFQTLEVLSS